MPNIKNNIRNLIKIIQLSFVYSMPVSKGNLEGLLHSASLHSALQKIIFPSGAKFQSKFCCSLVLDLMERSCVRTFESR